MLTLTRQDTSAMKGIAILAMLCHHMYGFPPQWAEPYTGVLAWLGILGKVCVALFLFCSGYGLSAQYESKSIVENVKFISKRLFKFYINYWVIFLIFVPITIFFFDRSLSMAYGDHVNIPKRLIFDLLGMQELSSYNVTWWFNKLIITLYLLFPLLYRLTRLKPWIAAIVGFIIMQIAIYYTDAPVSVLIWQYPFILGIVWKLYENKGTQVQEWLEGHRMVSICVSVLLLIVTVIIRMYPIIPYCNGIGIDGFVSCAIALCVITILRNFPHIMSVFAFLGKHSINIYLIHTFFNDFWHLSWLHDCEWLRGG